MADKEAMTSAPLGKAVGSPRLLPPAEVDLDVMALLIGCRDMDHLIPGIAATSTVLAFHRTNASWSVATSPQNDELKVSSLTFRECIG